MAPLAFSFEGIKIYIFYQDHNPIHIHAEYQNTQSIYELIIENNKLVNITIRQTGKEQLPPAQNKKVNKFLKKHWKLVVEKWVDIVILGKRVTLKRISGL